MTPQDLIRMLDTPGLYFIGNVLDRAKDKLIVISQERKLYALRLDHELTISTLSPGAYIFGHVEIGGPVGRFDDMLRSRRL